MRKNIEIRKDIKYIAILLAVTIIPKIIIALLQEPIQVGDELGNLSALAYFAGLDWSDVWEKVAYYGTGYHIIFTFLFSITDNPYIIYRTILISYVFIEAIVGLIVYYLCRRYFLKKDSQLACILSIIVVYFQYNKDTWISNEPVVFLLVWVTLLLIIELYNSLDDKKRKRILTVGLALVLAYALTVHTRLAILYGILICLFIYVALTRKKSLFDIPIFVLVMAVGVAAVGNYNDWITDVVWLQHREATSVHNSDVVGILGSLRNITKLTTKRYWHGFLNTLIGQTDTANVMTGGVWVLSIVIGLKMLFDSLIKFIKKQDISFGIGQETVVALYGGLGSIGLLFLQALIWLNRAKETLDLGYGTQVFHTTLNYARVFVYMRYFAPFMGPLVLIALIYIVKNNVWKEYIIAFVISIIGQIYWLRYVLPMLYNNITTARVYIPFSFGTYDQVCSWGTYLPASVFLIISIIGLGFLLKKRKIRSICVCLGIILIYQYMHYGFLHENDYSTRADGGYRLVSLLEESMEIDETICVPYPVMTYAYQLMLNRYSVQSTIPSKSDDLMIFTNRFSEYEYDEYLTQYGYRAFKLDSNEYVYVKDKELTEKIRALGYSLFFVGDFIDELRNGTLDILNNEEYVKLIYTTLLNREADVIGLETWSQALDEGLEREELYRIITESEEYQTKHGE